jgi:hypothetical protein
MNHLPRPMLPGLFTLICGLLFCTSALAVPRMSLTAGTPCSACHVNGQGGGMRTEIGWGTALYTGAYIPEKFEEMESNSYFDGLIAVGLDARVQVARFGTPSPGSDELPARRVIPMQLQPYVSAYPTEWLTLYGSYNVGPSVLRGDGICNPVYAGQSCFEAAAKIQPSYTAPYVRLGNFQPSIGIRHDDHTMLQRGDAKNARQPVIAPNYAELGGELTYTPVHWFSTDAGAFRAANLSEAIADDEVVGENDIAYLGRAQVMPRLDDLDLVSWIGASLYGAGSWHIENYFVGVGKLDTASLMFEVSRSDRGKERDYKTLNLMAKVDVPIKEWIVLSGRVEQATTNENDDEFQTQQAVVGAEFFPVPFVEIRPEYRFTRTDRYQVGQYALQLHVFY